MSRLVSGGSFAITWLRALLCILGVAACVAALSAITLHDFGDHYRTGEIGRLASHHAVLAQPNDTRGDKARLTGRIQPRVFLLTTDTARVNHLERFEPAPQPSLCRLLLRLKLGSRSRSDDNPAILSL